jgi:hypothetical protein
MLADHSAVLLMDSVLPHVLNRVLLVLGENAIIAFTFLAHITNLFQTLDLVFFETLKYLKVTVMGDFNDDSVNEHITKLIQVYKQTATLATIKRSFRRVGLGLRLGLDVTVRPFKIQVNEEMIRETSGFKAVWERNISIEALSRWKQMQRFGIINLEFLP